jgi:RHS repeat-associated protein
VWLADTPVAVIKPTTPDPTLYFIHSDHLDTPRIISNQAQQAVWRWDNDDPFGANMANENPSGLGTFAFNLRFPGQYFDKETNLHYNTFRDYSPEIGRYIESDPVGVSAGPNTYSYVSSNPVGFSDPLGLRTFNPFDPLSQGPGGPGSLGGVAGGAAASGLILSTMPKGGTGTNTSTTSSSSTEEQCCKATDTRTAAFMKAAEYAGLDSGWVSTPWSQYNRPRSKADQSAYTEFRQGIGNDPYGYQNPASGGEIVEHPADSDHPCPHFHAKKHLGGRAMIFPYKSGSQ